MPSVAIVTARACDGTTGGAERLYDGLVEAFRAAGWETVEFPIMFDESGFQSIVDGYERVRRLNLLAFDLVVSTKAPTYAIWHPNHACWLLHTIRVFYDRFDQTFPAAPNWALDNQATIHELDNRYLTQSGLRLHTIGKTVSRRLENFNGLLGAIVHPPHPDAARFIKSNRDEGYLFTCSRLHSWKRLDLLIEAVRLMTAQVELRIAGDGPERAELERRAADLPNIRFLGQLDNEALRQQYANARAVPFVPISEDYGYITIEAFLTGKPVVTVSDAGEVTEIVAASGGGLVANPDAASLAQALDQICTSSTAAKKLGSAGYAWATQLQWPAIVKELSIGQI